MKEKWPDNKDVCGQLIEMYVDVSLLVYVVNGDIQNMKLHSKAF